MTTDITPADLAARLEELAGRVTPGPWRATGLPYNGLDDPVIVGGPDETYVCQTVYDMQSMTTEHDVDSDTELITLLGSNLLTIIAALRAGEKSRRELNDSRYMIEALVQMLGPNGLKVWHSWQEKGVVRVHYSWASAPMTGEERAAAILEFDAAPRTLAHDVDAHITALALPTAPEGEGK